MLEITGLHASIGGKEILRGVDLSVKAGEVHAIMGPNGSGNSSLLKVMVGAIAPTEGTACVDRRRLTLTLGCLS